MTSLLPRLRTDLIVKQTTDALGVTYYDIHDPITSGMLRLYDFEWSLAQGLSEPRTLSDYQTWSKTIVGFEPSNEELSEFVKTLVQFGLCMQIPIESKESKPPRLLPKEATMTLGASETSDKAPSPLVEPPRPIVQEKQSSHPSAQRTRISIRTIVQSFCLLLLATLIVLTVLLAQSLGTVQP